MNSKVITLAVIFFGMLHSMDLSAQDIKCLDHVHLYKKHKFTRLSIQQIQYKKADKDTATIGLIQINEKGQMYQYKEFNSAGQLILTQEYNYNAKGQLESNFIEFAEKPGQKFQFKLQFNSMGQLLSREIDDCGVNFWHKEIFVYSPKKVLIESTRHYNNGDKPITITERYPNDISPKENTMNYIYDQRGLLLLHQYYNAQNQLTKTHRYQYQ